MGLPLRLCDLEKIVVDQKALVDAKLLELEAEIDALKIAMDTHSHGA